MRRCVGVGGLALVIAGLAACGGDTPKCVVGSTAECLCAPEVRGVQHCNDHGAFDACDCGGQTPSAPGAPSTAETATIDSATPQPASNHAPCDPAGRWTLNSTLKGTSCERGSFSDSFTLVSTGSGKWDVGKTKGNPVKLKSVTADEGACVLTLESAVDPCPSCRPPEGMIYHFYELTERNGAVTGTGTLRVEPDFDAEEAGEKDCVQKFTIKGTRKGLTKSDSRFDAPAAKAAFVELYEEFLNECDFPALENDRRRVVNARLTIGTDGSVRSLKLDGVEQDPRASCLDKHQPFLEGLAPNTTGKPQVVTFSLAIGKGQLAGSALVSAVEMLANEACACKTKQCADAVHTRLLRYIKDTTEPSKSDQDKISARLRRLIQCRDNLGRTDEDRATTRH